MIFSCVDSRRLLSPVPQTPALGLLGRYFADVIEVHGLLICSKPVILGSLGGPDSDRGRVLVTEEEGPPMSRSVSLCQGLWPAFHLWTCLACPTTPKPISSNKSPNITPYRLNLTDIDGITQNRGSQTRPRSQT